MRVLEIQIFFLSGSSDKLGKRKRQFFPGALFHFLEIFFSIKVESRLSLTRITKRGVICSCPPLSQDMFPILCHWLDEQCISIFLTRQQHG